VTSVFPVVEGVAGDEGGSDGSVNEDG